jgi:vacuolar-type H+-ATPase subunit I/STV1
MDPAGIQQDQALVEIDRFRSIEPFQRVSVSMQQGDAQDQIADLRRRLNEERAERRQTADRLATAQERIAAFDGSAGSITSPAKRG